jgi:tetratricopeptide (TPR) repeat protein
MSDEALRQLQRVHEESPGDFKAARSYLRALDQAGERGERLHGLWALLLREHYGVTFPPSLFQAWEFFVDLAAEAGADDPRYVLEDMGFTLSGPFQLIHLGLGNLDPPEVPLIMSWRYYMDPPEFFTVAHGEADGLHWGYWFDDPDAGAQPLVCSYFEDGAYEFSHDGSSLLCALDAHLAADLEGVEEELRRFPERGEVAEEAARYQALRERIARLREDFPQPPEVARATSVPTFGGMDLVVPGATPEQLLPADPLYQRASAGEDAAELVGEGEACLAEGNLPRAIQIANAAWIMRGCRPQHERAAELLARCYEALERPTLAWVARTQAKHRSIPSVDLLEEE